MNTAQLIVQLVKSRNAEGVMLVLDEYARENGLGSHLDLTTRFLGDHEANAHSVEAMGYSGNAAFEKITNMHDAVIDLLKRREWFRTDPKTPTEALREISDRQKEGVPGAYVAISTASHGRTTKRGRKEEANVSFIDEGTGILPLDMPKTILSIGGSNKLSDPLMMGCYGQGGSAIHDFAPFTLILSRSVDDPSVIGFTVVYERHFEGNKRSSYVYVTDADHEVLTARVEDIEASQIVASSELRKHTGRDLMDMVVGKLILPPNGTVVKAWNIENSPFTSPRPAYGFMRDRGFSMQAPTRLVVATTTKEESKRIRSHLEVRGHRQTLSDMSAVGSSNYHNIAQRTGLREVLDGKADIHCWIRDRTVKETGSEDADAIRRKSQSVVEGITSLPERVGTSIYVTLNGMTHYNLRTPVILRNVGLELLVPYFFMEIDCDGLDYRTKGMLFTSSREGMKREYQEKLRLEIERWLANEASDPESQISKAHRMILDRTISDRTDNAASQNYTETFARIMNSTVMGSILSLFGRSGTKAGGRSPDGDDGDPVKGSVSGKGESPSPVPSDHKEPPARIINEIPTFIRMRKATVMPGRSEYVHVATDAPDSWSHAISISLPDILVLRDSPELDNGRISYLVDAVGRIGSKGVISVRLDRSSVGMEDLHAQCEVEIVKRTPIEKAEGPKPPKVDRGIPDIRIIDAVPNGENWDQMGAREEDEGLLAMTYFQNGDTTYVVWNTEFEPVVSAAKEVLAKSGRLESETLIAHCRMHSQILALMHRENGGGFPESSDKVRWGEAIAAYAIQQAAEKTMDAKRTRTNGDVEDLFAGT